MRLERNRFRSRSSRASGSDNSGTDSSSGAGRRTATGNTGSADRSHSPGRRRTDIVREPQGSSPANRCRKEPSIRDQNTQVPGSQHRAATALPREGGLERRHNNRPKGQMNLVGPIRHSRGRPKWGQERRGLERLELDKVRPVRSRPHRSRLKPSRSFRT